MYKFSEREFYQSEIDAGIEKLVDKVECNDIDWDEDGSYKADLIDDILLINFYTKIDSDEKWFDIRQVIDRYVLCWATSEVNSNPNKYCTFINPNDDL